MITNFINSKLKQATYKILKDGIFFSEIKSMPGVWAEAKNMENCREKLKEVLEDWIIVKIRSGERIPGFRLDFDRRNQFSYA